MDRKKRQWITVGVLSVVLVALAIYRLAGRSTPAETHAGTVAQDSFVVPPNAGDVGVTNDSPVWDLPDISEVLAIRTVSFDLPRRNPFILSDRLRIAIQNDDQPTNAEPVVKSSGTLPEYPPPQIRSTLLIGDQWFAEIDKDLFGVGDSIRGYRILEIGQLSVTFGPSGGSAESLGGEQFREGSCSLRVGEDTSVFSQGRWLDSIDATHAQAGSTKNAGSHIRVPVGKDHD